MTSLPPYPPDLPHLEVDPGAIRDYADAVLTGSAQVDDLGTFAAGRAHVAGWRGASAAAYEQDIAVVGTRADASSLALRGVGLRVDQHADAMQRLRSEHTTLALHRDDLQRAVGALHLRAPLVPATQLSAFRQECDDVAREVRRLAHDVTDWSARLATEEAEMSAAFVVAMTVEQAVRTYGGCPDPADDALGCRPRAGAGPRAFHDWWTGLTHDQQVAVCLAAPGAVGNLDGIPAWARDRANRVSLDRDLATWTDLDRRGQLTPQERRWLANAQAARDALDRIGDEVDPATGAPLPAQLHTYEPAAFGGDGCVAIAVGDLGSADNVAVIVPGLGTDMQSAEAQAVRAVDLHRDVRSLDPAASAATMLWIGHDCPDNLAGDHDSAGVVTEHLATQGADRLSDTLDGLESGRPDDPAHVTVIGHSYGSTTTGIAATDHHLPVDDVVVVGSPGLGEHAHHAGDLQVPQGHVWVGAASHDPVTWLGDHGWVGGGDVTGGAGLGTDPADDTFHGIRFDAEPAPQGPHWSIEDHSSYFQPGSECLDNIAHVVNGQYAAVTHAPPRHDPWWGPPYDPAA